MTYATKGESSTTSHQERLRIETTRIVGASMLRTLRQLDVSYTIRDAATIYAVLFGTVALTCYLHSKLGWLALLGTPLLALSTGIAFNWINVQIHEASHHNLFANKAFNDVFCNLFLGAFALQNVQTYRSTHGMHHAHLHTERDPDLWTYSSRLGSVREVLRGIGDDVLLRTAFRRKRQVAAFLKLTQRSQGRAPRYVGPATAVAQLAVLAIFINWCGPWGFAYYALTYLYGLLAVFPALIRIRTVVQHGDGRGHFGDAAAAMTFTSRTTVAPFLEFFVLGARMDYHFEHHLHPNIPYYNLKTMHRALQAAGLFETIQASTGQELHTDDYVRTFVKLAT
jgi:fatty acid desaturase